MQNQHLRNERLVIGPANHAGQAREWCQAATRHFGIDAASIELSARPSLRGKLRDAATHALPYHRLTPGVARRLLVERYLRLATCVAIDGFVPLYEDPKNGSLPRDIHRIQHDGRKVALIAHGSDVRDPELHMQRIESSHFLAGSKSWRDALGEQASRNREIAGSTGVPLLVSTPDLLLDLPTATWLPLVVRLDEWKTGKQVLREKKPRVVHVPSARRPPIKGTKSIDPVLEQLAQDNLIDYVTRDLISHNQLKPLVQSADIVVDQILVGSYGVAAVEAMAAGRVVVGNIALDVRERIPSRVPVVDATPDNFRNVILHILANRDMYRALAAEGRQYVQNFHSGSVSAGVLAATFGWSSLDLG